jgi:hypothetical protein
MYFKKKLDEIEMKMQKFRNILISKIARSELQTNNHDMYYHQIPLFPQCKTVYK